MMFNQKTWKRAWAYAIMICLAMILSISMEILVVQSPSLSGSSHPKRTARQVRIQRPARLNLPR